MSITKKAFPATLCEWVANKKAAELLGLTTQAIYAKIKRRDWREGAEYKKRGSRLFINLPAVYAWIEQA